LQSRRLQSVIFLEVHQEQHTLLTMQLQLPAENFRSMVLRFYAEYFQERPSRGTCKL
jgi:hypothetical protein